MRAKYDIQEYAPRGHVDYGTDESAASLESESDRKIRAGCIKVVNTQDERQGTLTNRAGVKTKPGWMLTSILRPR
ncbi:hypothetical protein F442_17284 [Phytophthora nicotianae P10297]|uniref:Uncharacterized protein n=2 Tax=Phytophthora nicotianae TaxID=4792 RepID=W2YH29_PHYNI|nr:hypothetical protein L917_16693 [Phytophthora nicotianae]ETP34350.1 hypothetical protein F442_17284 [Phytophthora nicotianae P10297]